MLFIIMLVTGSKAHQNLRILALQVGWGRVLVKLKDYTQDSVSYNSNSAVDVLR